MPTNSAPGFLLLDSRLRPVAYNAEGLSILSYPTKPESIRQLPQFLSDKVRATLVSGGSFDKPIFARECSSGRRTYNCRTVRLDFDGSTLTKLSPLAFAILLERHNSGGAAALDVLARQFDLTARECETVALLLEGLTSKEIATRMNISPNTVKAFLRLVMLKMDVSTRSGIVGKAVRQVQFG
jgi:DNA-binding CsgD family transcriptional regulator